MVLWKRKPGHPTDNSFNSDDGAAEAEATPGLRGRAELHEPLNGAERSRGGPHGRPAAYSAALPSGQVEARCLPHLQLCCHPPSPSQALASGSARARSCLVSTLEETRFTLVP